MGYTSKHGFNYQQFSRFQIQYAHEDSLLELSIQSPVRKPTPILDAEGYAICPDCSTRIKCGPAGLKNLEKRHRGTDTCKTAQAKRDKNAKTKKNGSILSFLRPRAGPVPSTVSSLALVHGHKLALATLRDTGPTTTTADPLGNEASSPAILSVSEPIMEGFISELKNLIRNLPLSIPEASEFDQLSIFAAEPRSFENPAIDAADLWETSLNNVFKATLGWGKEGNMEKINSV
jgi:hypothetical protein